MGEGVKLWVVRTQAPRGMTNWVPPRQLRTIVQRGTTVDDAWFWGVRTAQQADALLAEIRRANAGARPAMRLTKTHRVIPSAWL